MLMPVLLLLAYLVMGFVVVAAGLVCAAVKGVVRGRSNCLLYAFSRYYYEGGSVIVQRSAHGWWPHFLYTLDGVTRYEFFPVPRLLKKKRRLPPVIFEGRVRVTTWPPQKET